MRGSFFHPVTIVAAVLPLAAVNAYPQEVERQERLDSVVVSASRAEASTPVTFTMVGRDELRSSNPMRSLPEVLSLQPSVVTYNEGGTGLGNSAITIRGSKGSQINVTLNGITLNDSESQEVFWVNIPSLTNLISSVQIQRGLGTTANGSGAFGASINMNTASVSSDPWAAVDFSAGSWNTFSTSVSASTGLLPGGFYANAAYNRSSTDGYIRNAFVQSQSAFVALGWMHGSNSLRLTWLMGDQRSGITWDGIDLDTYAKDRRHNDAGAYEDEYGNTYYYDNQTDNYVQNHLQLNYTHQFSDALTWTTTLNYTRGDGYDEYYKQGKTLSDYGFPASVSGTDGLQYESSDMIYQKKMGNDYWVLNSDLRYHSDRLKLTAGLNLSRYIGDHWGKMLWAKVLGDDYDYSSMNASNAWYRNDADKRELDAFARAEYLVAPRLTLYGDVQLRRVSLEMEGLDDDKASVGFDKAWTFLNPRLGLNYDFGDRSRAYLSAAWGNREPGRSDIKENVKGTGSPIKPEKMLDLELGYSCSGRSWSVGADVYAMEYWDMLLETGRLSSSGYAVKENVPRGWRRGVELSGVWSPAGWIRLDANASFSTNQIDDYTSYVEVWDAGDGDDLTKAFEWGRTRMLLSPSFTGMAKVTVTPWKNSARGSLRTTTFSIDGKYVGRQYLDNTQRDEMEIPRYFVMNASLSHEFKLGGGFLGLSGYVGNLLNNEYWAYGWRWEGCYKASTKEEIESGIGVYPQAAINCTLKVSYRF